MLLTNEIGGGGAGRAAVFPRGAGRTVNRAAEA